MPWSAPGAVWWITLASLVALLQTIRIAWTRFSRTRTLRARARHAVKGEMRAEGVLRAAGFDVLERQVRGTWTVYAADEPLEIGLRADLLVARGGRRYVAEVKTGRVAPRLDHAATRRQLLEYRIAFGVDGVLLVDADAERVTSVELGVDVQRGRTGEERRTGAWAVAFASGLALGGAAGWLLHG